MIVERIVRYPVKGMPGVAASGPVALHPGRGLRWDRSHAVARAPLADPDPPDEHGAVPWQPRERLLHLAKDDVLTRFGVELTDPEGDAPVLTVVDPDGARARGVLGGPLPALQRLLGQWLSDRSDLQPRLVATRAAGLWDWPAAHLSLINLATVEAIAREAGREVDDRRFRGNLLLRGLDAFQEYSLVGSRLSIGDAVLEVFQATDRCRATTIEPEAGVSDLNVPGLLAARFGHMFCGVYARVITPGAVRPGDVIRVVGAADAGALAPQPEWPRTARVLARQPETDDVLSLWLEDSFGLLQTATATGHLRVHLPGEAGPNWRSYTISGVEPERARISVKRDGRISGVLHDRVEIGGEVLVSGPFQDLPDPGDPDRDVLLISAGIGITPTVAALRARPGTRGRVRVLHVERTADAVPLWAEVRGACERIDDAAAVLHLTRAGSAVPREREGRVTVAHGRPGRADIATLLRGLDPSTVEVFLCGPAPFVAETRAHLTELGLPAERVHADAFFSPASLTWTEAREARTAGPHRIETDGGAFVWTAAAGTLLDAAEAAGLGWRSGCRAGVCGTCVRRVDDGDVEYLQQPLADPGAGRILACCAAPLTDMRLGASP